jgi:hypothetical protein
VKVLDFGLAKAVHDVSVADPDSPTGTLGRTAEGALLGTAPYMSPEQARGKPVDRRTDIWAFGCVLYEMLTGRRAFAGDTLADTISDIMNREPDWAAIPASVPEDIARVIRRCLQQDPARRLRDIADARLEMDEALHESPRSPLHASSVSRGFWGLRWFAALASAVAVAAIAAWYFGGSEAVPREVRFEICRIRAPRTTGDSPADTVRKRENGSTFSESVAAGFECDRGDVSVATASGGGQAAVL